MLFAATWIFLFAWFLLFIWEYDTNKGFLMAIWEALGLAICIAIVVVLCGLLGHWMMELASGTFQARYIGG